MQRQIVLKKKLIPIVTAVLFLIGIAYNEPLLYRLLAAADSAFNRVIGQEDAVILKENTAEIHILDVGQADAVVITCGDKTMLVDAGESDTAAYVKNYIKSLGIERFDKVVATHPHSDHIGGMEAVLDVYEADEIIMPYAVYETKLYEDLLTKISEMGLAVTEPEPGSTIPFGDAELLMLSPAPETEWEDVNNESVMFIFSFNGVRMLFTGDAEAAAEQVVLDAGYDIDCDLMKVGHHGSKTSSSEAFLDAVSPEIAFVTCEVDSKDNLPVQSVLERYTKRNCELYRSDENGTIVITIDEAGDVSIVCANEKT